MINNVTYKLAEFVSELKYDDIPKQTVDNTKRMIVDYIGVLVAGVHYNTPLSNGILEIIDEMGGAEDATIIGKSKKVPLINAALANGVLSHVVELDDGHRIARGHPGVTVMSVAIPLAEYLGVSGKDFITAIVVGYDVFVRLASSVNPSHLNRGFHTTGTCGTFASAATAAKLLGLDAEKTTYAIGLAGIQASGLLEVTEDGQMSKPLHPGKAAYSGVLAAMLAQKGVRGPRSVIEGVKGFATAFSDEVDYNVIINNKVEGYYIDECYIKLYPSCRHTHASLDATLDMVISNDLEVKNISEINIYTFSTAISFVGKIWQPKNENEAKFSLPYCVSTAIKHREFGLKQMENSYLMDSEVLELTKKVKIYQDESLESEYSKSKGARVIIKLNDGTELTKQIDLPKGESENPVTIEEILRKFSSNTKQYYNSDGVNNIVSSVLNIDDAENILKLIEIIQTDILLKGGE